MAPRLPSSSGESRDATLMTTESKLDLTGWDGGSAYVTGVIVVKNPKPKG